MELRLGQNVKVPVLSVVCMFSNYSEWKYTMPDFVGNN